MTLSWSRRPFIYGVIYSSIICGTSYLLKTSFSLPWQPVSVIGISVAFYLGFKNNSSYDRVWEARKIWGSIVNNSRTFGAAALSFVQGERASEIQKELIYRHIAWLTALRHQLRLSRPWEHVENRISGVYSPTICENYNTKLEKELSQYISDEEIREVTSKSNAATQLLKKNRYVYNS